MELPLYHPQFEHDACGVGFVADLHGRPSHDIVQLAVRSVGNLTHRGAMDADGKSGDGAGVLTQLPWKLLAREAERLGLRLPHSGRLALGMIFLPGQDPAGRDRCVSILEEAIARRGLHLLAWRQVPVDSSALGQKARLTQPDIRQVLVARPEGMDIATFRRSVYLARKEAEQRVSALGINDFFVASFSTRTVVYKGLFVAPQLAAFYLDLRDPDFQSGLAIFHQRYSTNTFPNWQLAQPFRYLAHNGEINTLQGNRNWMRAREAQLADSPWGEDAATLSPVVLPWGSDSLSLDNVLELLHLSGHELLQAMMMLVPEAWEEMPDMDPDLRAFYEHHAPRMEPWDGPAALAFTDGATVGACLDRNGLRPARYKVTDTDLVIVASEVGAVEVDDWHVVEKGRLGPGQMLAVDTRGGRLLRNADIKREIAGRRPYQDLVRQEVFFLGTGRPGPEAGGQESRDGRNGSISAPAPLSSAPLTARQRAFGYTAEEVKFVLRPMAAEGKDPTFSMGDDTPLAVLSRMPRLLYSYFKQRFAQVTNPPIDPLRETLVMSLLTYLGARPVLTEHEAGGYFLKLESPILLDEDMEALRNLRDPRLQVREISVLFDVQDGPEGLEPALDRICREAEAAVDAGATILVLSDRGVDNRHAPVPMLMAVGAVHHHLIRVGKRMRADIVAQAGDAWDVHHFALLIGYGASAVHPHLALESIRASSHEALVSEPGPGTEAGDRELCENFRHAAEQGLLKIISKMGISTLSAYRGAQIFEALGLDDAVVDRCFAGTPSRIGGIGFAQIGEDVLARHREAFGEKAGVKLPDYGYIRYRRDGEYHGWEPPVVRALHTASISGDPSAYRTFASLVNGRQPMALRDLMRFRTGRSIPVEEVEPAEEIARRFISTAMSLGALSPEAHRALAIAMNRMGARSNSGEGGEDPDSYLPLPNGDVAHNKIKQVASARFGVTTEYLIQAEELEIKMAQGSKPGEGGQLPAHKVTELIARFRHAIPGIHLISPPPHHDIYSIEDLAQLIYDLKQVNPRAKVGVKLVAEAGVGTIAAGVAKAYADYVLISGHDGGTGSSPLSSIKNAGCPWELGLAETQQVLVMNGLRDRILVRTDGGLKTGRDVVMAALLGAEEFGFGTGAIVALGCAMARQCHLNTCPTGIATQRPDLRARFEGTPERVINYFMHVAQEVREILASMGFRRLDDIIGRVDLLEPIERPADSRAALVDLSAILTPVDSDQPLRHLLPRNDRPPDSPTGGLDEAMLRDAAPALERKQAVKLRYPIRNSDRTVGARLAGEVTRRYGLRGLPPGTIEVTFEGSAGQSFGAFCVDGMRLVLIGEANDYVGKGMSGGEIVVMPPREAKFASHENVIMGNTVLYGATGGKLFVAGRAGERFAVRNSGAVAVVEGAGDHCCEYMTSGVVVVLGETGRNFGAGMAAGVAYVLDEDGTFPRRYNPEMVGLERPVTPDDLEQLYLLVEEHFAHTLSRRARQVLDLWDVYRTRFWKVVPHPPIVTTTHETVTGRPMTLPQSTREPEVRSPEPEAEGGRGR